MKVSLYNTYTTVELRKRLPQILDEAEKSRVIIRSKGRSFVLEAYSPTVAQPEAGFVLPIGVVCGNVSL